MEKQLIKMYYVILDYDEINCDCQHPVMYPDILGGDWYIHQIHEDVMISVEQVIFPKLCLQML